MTLVVKDLVVVAIVITIKQVANAQIQRATKVANTLIAPADLGAAKLLGILARDK